MTEIIEVPTTTNTTSKLQALINKTGNISAKYIFPAMKITVDVPLTYYNNTEFAGSGINSTIFKLMKDAPTTIFKEGTPLLAPKNPTAAENIIIHDIAFDGTRDSQAYVKKLYNKPWGHGYHNILMLGVFGNPAYTNTKNCKLYNLSFKDSLGDGIRAEGIYNVTIHDIYGERVGHDLICLVADTASVYKVKAKIDVNAGIRTRSARNVKMWDCEIDGSGGTAYSPGFEVQSTASNWKSYNIEIWNCYVHDTFGPGVQIIGTVPNNSDIQIHHCVFENCGEMPPANKLPYVGGVVFDGFNNIKIYSNDFIGCLGNSVSNAKYDIAGSMSGLTAEVYNNIFYGTKKALYPNGDGAGAAIANILKHYKITSHGNCFYGNVSDLYGVTSTSDIHVDPLFVGTKDYHLKSILGHYTESGIVYDSETSPCIFEKYEIGCYDGTKQMSVYVPKPSHVLPNDIVGNHSAVIIVCNTEEQATRLSAVLKVTLDDEKMVVYSP